MKYRVVVEIVAEDLLEEQFILQKFPGAWWTKAPGISSSAKTAFYVSGSEEDNVRKALAEYKQVKRRLENETIVS